MMMRRLKRVLVTIAGVAAISACCGCGDDASQGKDLQVTNAQDNFQFQVTDMKHYTKTYAYFWVNSGTAASVNQACSISSGVPTLSIRDAANTLVYSRDLRQNGNFPTSAGTSGTWKITLTVTDVTGTLNFRVQKSP